jgi:Tfp pilus assembly protein PilV
MIDFPLTPRLKRRPDAARISGSRATTRWAGPLGRRLARMRGAAGSQSGISMIEVLVSALLLALIVIGTFSGLDAAGRASADERAHAQATVLAQQDQERLRSMTAAEIAQLGTSAAPRIVAEGSTKFTVSSSAQFVSSASEEFTCSTSGGAADYLQTTSSVTWPALGARDPVTQSSIVSTPVSAGLLVKVIDQNSKGLAGATVSVTGATSQTTPSSGCVIFGDITPGAVIAQATAGSDVDIRGKTPTSKEVEVTGKTLASTELQLAPPGTIVAEFENKGKAVTGSTFFALNSGIPTPPDFVGGAPSTFVATARQESLFPFTSAYTVFAGDCEKNNPEVVASPNPIVSGKKEVIDPTATLVAGGQNTVKVEEPEVSGVQVFEGTKASPGSAVSSPSSAKMINIECKATNSQNYTPIEYKHTVTFDASGNLVQKYWPYAAKLEFCVVSLKSGTYYKYQGAFANTARAGVAGPKVYLKETTTGYSKSTSKLEC